MAEQRCALVTGGAQGIGKATVRRLLGDGWAVAFIDINEAAGRETAAEYASLGPLRFLLADVADEGQVARAMAEAVARYAGLDLLVNDAAISAGGPVETLSLEAWNRVLAVNLTGPFLCARHAAPHLRARQGSIVNIASTRALMSESHTEAYAASKGGLVALTHALAVSLGPDVRVNCISPGWIEVGDWQQTARRRAPEHTDADRRQHPAGRVGVPDDIAAMIAFLASPAAGFITGQNLVIDGGMTKRMVYV